jgi:peptide/nickel transport system substrate-binding protein
MWRSMTAVRRRTLLGLSAVVSIAFGCRPQRAPLPDQLVVAYPNGPSDLVSYRSADEAANSILRNAYEPLVDLDANLRIVPCLATTWYNPDDNSWVFQLRQGLRLHDGRPLTAYQVAEFFNLARTDARSVRVPSDLIRAIEAPDAHTIVFRTSRPVGWLPTQLARLLISVPGQSPEAPPVGTGPYVVRSWTPRGDTVLEASAAYREGAPPIKHLVFRVVPDAHQAVQQLREGRIHLMLDAPLVDWPGLVGTPGVSTFAQPGLRVVFLGFNMLRPEGPLRDAIALAIDRRAILDGPLKYGGEPMSELVPPEVFGHHGGLAEQPFDPGASRQLLAQARPGLPLSLSLEYEPGRYPGIDVVASMIAANLKAVGLEVRPTSLASQSLRNRLDAPQGADLFLLGWLSAGDAGSSLQYLVHSPAGGSTGALSGYSNPEVDRLLEAAAGPTSLPGRMAALRQVAEILHREVAVVPLYRQRDRYAFAEGLHFTPRRDRRIRAFEIHWHDGDLKSPPD